MLVLIVFIIYAASASYIYADYDAALTIPLPLATRSLVLPIPPQNFLIAKKPSPPKKQTATQNTSQPLENTPQADNTLPLDSVQPFVSDVAPATTNNPYTYGLPHRETVFLLYLSLGFFSMGMILFTADQWLELIREVKAFLFPRSSSLNPSENLIHPL